MICDDLVQDAEAERQVGVRPRAELADHPRAEQEEVARRHGVGRGFLLGRDQGLRPAHGVLPGGVRNGSSDGVRRAGLLSSCALCFLPSAVAKAESTRHEHGEDGTQSIATWEPGGKDTSLPDGCSPGEASRGPRPTDFRRNRPRRRKREVRRVGRVASGRNSGRTIPLESPRFDARACREMTVSRPAARLATPRGGSVAGRDRRPLVSTHKGTFAASDGLGGPPTARRCVVPPSDARYPRRGRRARGVRTIAGLEPLEGRELLAYSPLGYSLPDLTVHGLLGAGGLVG